MLRVDLGMKPYSLKTIVAIIKSINRELLLLLYCRLELVFPWSTSMGWRNFSTITVCPNEIGNGHLDKLGYFYAVQEWTLHCLDMNTFMSDIGQFMTFRYKL